MVSVLLYVSISYFLSQTYPTFSFYCYIVIMCRAANTIITNLPEMRKTLVDALDMIFTPKQIATQLVLAMALETSMVCCFFAKVDIFCILLY